MQYESRPITPLAMELLEDATKGGMGQEEMLLPEKAGHLHCTWLCHRQTDLNLGTPLSQASALIFLISKKQ